MITTDSHSQCGDFNQPPWCPNRALQAAKTQPNRLLRAQEVLDEHGDAGVSKNVAP